MDRKELLDGINRLVNNMPEGTSSANFSWTKGERQMTVGFSDQGHGSATIYIGDYQSAPLQALSPAPSGNSVGQAATLAATPSPELTGVGSDAVTGASATVIPISS